MSVKQINVFLENRAGHLADVTEVLSKNKIDIRSLHIADTAEYGILRLIVDQPDEAQIVLQSAGFAVNQSSVLAVSIKDVPGTLDKVIRVLADNDISLEYIYAFVGHNTRDAVVVVRVDDESRAIAAYESAGIRVLTDKEVYGF